MIANVQNQNFGYSVACDGNWAAVGNPTFFRYDPLTGSIIRTGSVEVYKYNINSDIHDKKDILHRPLTAPEDVLLSTEISNSAPTGPYYYIHTEYTGTVAITADKDLLVDVGQYYSASEDGYGLALDMKNAILTVGVPYFESRFTFDTASFFYTGSGYVDLFDLSRLDIDPYIKRAPPIIVGSFFVGSFLAFQVYVAPGQNYSYVTYQTKNPSLPNDYWQDSGISNVDFNTNKLGGTVVIQTNLTSISLLDTRVIAVVGTDPYLTTIFNPHTEVSESFGLSVSINDEWLAVGSPLESGSMGSVFMYRKVAEDNLSWSFVQSLPLPPNLTAGDNFGSSVEVNKASSSFSWSMIVGSKKPSHSRAYIYEFNGTKWLNTFTLGPDNLTIYPLPFYPTLPIVSGYPNYADLFGYDVSIYADSVIVGAPTDRSIQEFESSSFYSEGAVYFFERCPNRDRGYYQVKKSYGNQKVMKDNLLGWSVDIHDEYAIAGIPKITILSSSICYLRATLFQDHFCEASPEASLQGQFILYNKDTASANIDWDITNVYQVKKRLLSPYRDYGWDTSLCDQFITIGAPMLISGSGTVMDLNAATGSYTGSLDIIGDLSGKAYIYNLKNLRPNFYVGNVFYRNGKIVVMTSGSNFEGLQLSNVIDSEYEYDMTFKSKQVVFEKQIVCPVEPGEFNVSTNPTAVVLTDAEFDVNKNGQFDFQDLDVLMRYMAYKSTESTGYPNPDWSSSIVDTATDEEPTVYDMYFSQWRGTEGLFTSSYSTINNTMFSSLDFNEDNKINQNDMHIFWKYFTYRLTQKNYESWITPSSKKKFLSDILDYMNQKTMRGYPSTIGQNFIDYARLSKQDETGSYLAPMVTSIGLYNGCDLVAIAKAWKPDKNYTRLPYKFRN